jgi:hypothetical protein
MLYHACTCVFTDPLVVPTAQRWRQQEQRSMWPCCDLGNAAVGACKHACRQQQQQLTATATVHLTTLYVLLQVCLVHSAVRRQTSSAVAGVLATVCKMCWSRCVNWESMQGTVDSKDPKQQDICMPLTGSGVLSMLIEYIFYLVA